LTSTPPLRGSSFPYCPNNNESAMWLWSNKYNCNSLPYWNLIFCGTYFDYPSRYMLLVNHGYDIWSPARYAPPQSIFIYPQYASSRYFPTVF
jgi:hypothetical protein